MRIHVLSDLHNEFTPFVPAPVQADVVVLAGDIDQGDAGLRWARTVWPQQRLLYVIGNHEYYNHDMAEVLARMQQTAQACDIHLLNDSEVVIDGVRFLGATLWTDFDYFGADKREMALEVGRNRLTDFSVIRNGERLFTPEDSIALHQRSLAWLHTRLAEPFAGRTVVVTHHLPSQKSVPARFMDTPLSACFVSHLDHLFGKMDLWIHGHTHDCFDYEANGTRVVCNPKGYVNPRGPENPDFDPRKVVEIG